MIVVGVDPGAVDTGLVVLDTSPAVTARRPAGSIALLSTATISRPAEPGRDLLNVPDEYLIDVNAAIASAVREYAPDLIGVENVKRPAWRVGGKVKPLDPTAIMATSIVLGAVLGRRWTVDLVRVPPDGNGSILPLHAYPEPLATKGKGHDKRRHERSAFDVALRARDLRNYARRVAR